MNKLHSDNHYPTKVDSTPLRAFLRDASRVLLACALIVVALGILECAMEKMP